MAKRGNGEGSIYQRGDGTWCAALTLDDGRRRYLYGKTRREVADKLREAQARIAKGLPERDSIMTVAQLLDDWLASCEQRLKPKTVENYRQMCRTHLVPALGKIALAKLQPQHVQRLINELSASGLSPRTVDYVRSVLARALAMAERRGLVTRNVAALADAPRQVPPQRQHLTPEQLQRVLTAASGTRWEVPIILAGVLGLRRGEVLGLHWSDIDTERRTLTVRRSVGLLRGTTTVSTPKTRSSERTIALTERAWSALEARRADVLAAYGVVDPDWPVVMTADQGYISPRNLYRAWRLILKQVGLPALPFHALRHTAATLLAEAGVPPHVAQRVLGHASISTTMNIYTHVLDSARSSAAAQLDALLAAISDDDVQQ